MKSPTEGAPDLNKTRAPLFDDDDEEEKPSTSAGWEDEADESLGDSAAFNHKRLRKGRFDDNANGDSEDVDMVHETESRKRMKDRHKDNKEGAKKAIDDSATSGRLVTARMQAAFQPGSTPSHTGKRNFLAYNMLGSVTTIENEGHSHVEVNLLFTCLLHKALNKLCVVALALCCSCDNFMHVFRLTSMTQEEAPESLP
jgi:chromosome transmission fidelity protein 4